MSNSQTTPEATSSTTTAAPPKGSSKRLGILLFVLAGSVAAMGYDRYVAKPAVQAAYNAIQGAGMNFVEGDTERIRKTKIADLQRQLTSELASVSSLAQGSFNIPVTGAGTVGLNGIMGGSNTQMNNNVNINAPGASAEEIFSIFVQKLEIEKLRTIGGQ